MNNLIRRREATQRNCITMVHVQKWFVYFINIHQVSATTLRCHLDIFFLSFSLFYVSSISNVLSSSALSLHWLWFTCWASLYVCIAQVYCLLCVVAVSECVCALSVCVLNNICMLLSAWTPDLMWSNCGVWYVYCLLPHYCMTVCVHVFMYPSCGGVSWFFFES